MLLYISLQHDLLGTGGGQENAIFFLFMCCNVEKGLISNFGNSIISVNALLLIFVRFMAL